MNTYYISVGSNMGDRQGFIDGAYAALQDHEQIATIETASIIETEPWGYTEQESFLNTVWRIRTDLQASAVLSILQTLEAAANRQRHIHWGPRTLDLDIIYGLDAAGKEMTIAEEGLTVPHLHFWDRLFVLEPLQDIAPDFTFKGESISERIAYLLTEAE